MELKGFAFLKRHTIIAKRLTTMFIKFPIFMKFYKVQKAAIRHFTSPKRN